MLENNIKYIIITPAYNEAAYIEYTIRSVLAQSVLPYKWVIVDDGSTDDTAKVIQQYAKDYKWIQYIHRIKEKGQSYYGSNVYAILQGYKFIKDCPYSYLAILDADISLCPNYYEEIFNRFEINLGLGIATGVYWEEVNGEFMEANIDRMSTPKALQVFRRECYEQIGGYIPYKNGGEDTCAEVTARMHGWKTWSFPEIKVIHNRPVGTGDGKTILQARFRLGLTDYCLATNPIFMFAKCLRRCLIEKPFCLSGLARLAGFIYGYVTGEEISIPADAKQYVRKEQIKRLLAYVKIGPQLWKPIRTDNSI